MTRGAGGGLFLHVIIIWICLGSSSLKAATWYVNDDNDGGTENGTSLATAWGKASDVNWASLSAGDTILISKGIYTAPFSATKGGTPASKITIKINPDPAEVGQVIFRSSGVVAFSGSGASNIVVNGALSDSFVAPTNAFGVTNRVTGTVITNNIGIWATNGISGFSCSAPMNGIEIRWVAQLYMTNHPSGYGSSHAFAFPIGSGGAQSGNLIQYCYVDLSGADGVQWSGGSPATGYDEKIVELCWFRNVGDDVFEVNHGFTIRKNFIEPGVQLSGHADFVQSIGPYIKIHDNVMLQGGLNSFMRIQNGYGSSSPIEYFNGYRIYNNLLVCETHPSLASPANPIEFVSTNPQNAGTNYIWDDVVFANNTIWGYTNDSSTVFSWNMSFGASSGNTTNVYVTNSIFANNLIVNSAKGISFDWDSDSSVPPYGFHHRPQDLIVDWNTVAATNNADNQRRIGYRGTAYADAVAFTAGESWKNNSTNLPVFFNAAGYNFELSSPIIGTNLNSYGLTNDILGRNRGTVWNQGAFESDSGLVLLLSFDSDASNTNATDDSGNGYTGKRFNLTEYGYPSNKVYNASGAPGLTLRPNFTGRYADFLWRTNNGVYNPTYFDDGSFYAVTNIEAAVTNLSQATIMIWARYNSASRTDIASPDYSDDGNAQLLSAGTATGTKGSWFLGRYNQRIWLNNTRFVIQTNEGFSGGTSFGTVGDPVIGYGSGNQVLFEFPDRGYDNNGDTTNWHHYAVTFSNGTVRTYFDGVAITNHTLSTMSVLNIGRGTSRPYNWLGVGVNTHVGTPEFENESGTDYPNNGWLNGALDQARIYSRALTHQEIVDVANSEGAAFADAPSEGGGGSGGSSSVTKAVTRGPMVFRGKVIVQ